MEGFWRSPKKIKGISIKIKKKITRQIFLKQIHDSKSVP
jgi:hypothetical protein